MMEAIRIRQQGYAMRESHTTFVKLYSKLSPESKTIVELVQNLSKKLRINAQDCQIGHTKVFMRKAMSDKLQRLLKLRGKVAARIIQSNWRHHRRQVSATKLQARWRCYSNHTSYKRMRASAIKIQSCRRGFKDRQAFVLLRNSSIKLQSMGRMIIAKNLVKKLSNPYRSMSKSELVGLRSEAKVELAQAMQSKDFTGCAKLQGKIDLLDIAIEECTIEDAAPEHGLSRAEIDEKIKSLEAETEALMEQKDFSKCAEVQAELQKFQKWKLDMPTLKEVLERVASLQKKFGDAEAKKDFVELARIQNDLERLEERKAILEKEAPAPEPEEEKEFASRQELENMIVSTHEKLDQVTSNTSHQTLQSSQTMHSANTHTLRCHMHIHIHT